MSYAEQLHAAQEAGLARALDQRALQCDRMATVPPPPTYRVEFAGCIYVQAYSREQACSEAMSHYLYEAELDTLKAHEE